MNNSQLEIHTQTIDRRLEEMMGHLQLPPTISMGFVYVVDATARRHPLSMNMARSFEVYCYRIYESLSYSLNFPAI